MPGRETDERPTDSTPDSEAQDAPETRRTDDSVSTEADATIVDETAERDTSVPDETENTSLPDSDFPPETKGSSTEVRQDLETTDASGQERTGTDAGRNVPGEHDDDGDYPGLDIVTSGADETQEPSGGLFDDLLSGDPIFENKEVLRPSYTPPELPHRETEIDTIATILVSALRGDTPSNILIYGKTGTGKTASARYVSEELEATSETYAVPCQVEYINCEVTDTQYRVLAQLANTFIERNEAHLEGRLDELRTLRDAAASEPAVLDATEFNRPEAVRTEIDRLETKLEESEPVPMTGWPTDRVYSRFFDAVDARERVVVIMLDEIDKLVEKSGDDTLYNLSRMNSHLERSRVSIMGISNDLKFTDFLDPRVKSSLGEEEIVFPPYDATQLRDILRHRADVAFEPGTLSDDVIPLCAAFAAQEHGDARRALDLLRTAGELAERNRTDTVEEAHVRRAQEKIELDRVVEVVRTLPTQSKLVLYATVLLEKHGANAINTGEVFNVYKRLSTELDVDVLTQRRVTDLISELDMLGIVNAVVVSKGRYGRSKEIGLSVPIEETEAVLLSDSRVGAVENVRPSMQSRFDI